MIKQVDKNVVRVGVERTSIRTILVARTLFMSRDDTSTEKILPIHILTLHQGRGKREKLITSKSIKDIQLRHITHSTHALNVE
jgi:hypothetical protein